jgi:hypothetical protein
MSKAARRFHPTARPAPTTKVGRKARRSKKQRAQKPGPHTNTYAEKAS